MIPLIIRKTRIYSVLGSWTVWTRMDREWTGHFPGPIQQIIY